MLGQQRSHEQYLDWLRPKLQDLLRRSPLLAYEYEGVLLKALMLNLDEARPILSTCYSTAMGRPVEFLPIDMFRTTVLMAAMKITSPSLWAWKLKVNPFLAILSGFEPSRTPSASAIYDFWDRLYSKDKELRRQEKKRLRRKRKRPKGAKNGQKLPSRKNGVCGRLLQSYRKGNFRSSKRPERLLQQLFTKVVVEASIAQGILPTSMDLAGDGSPFESASTPYGKRTCTCWEKGIYRCECPRRYTDPYANWGWDSSRNQYYYGRNLYTLTCVNGLYELPVFLRFGQAGRHDAPLSMFAIHEAKELLASIHAHMHVWIADSAHDVHAIYSLLDEYRIRPVIDLNTRKPLDSPITLADDGTPLCPGQQPMVYWGFEKARDRMKWRCPRKAGNKAKRAAVDCHQECQHCGPYGRSTYIPRTWNLRSFPEIPRGTEQWKTYYKKRTCSERINKRYNDFGLDTTRVKGNHAWHQIATLAATNMHLDAWIWHQIDTQKVDRQALIARYLEPQAQVPAA